MKYVVFIFLLLSCAKKEEIKPRCKDMIQFKDLNLLDSINNNKTIDLQNFLGKKSEAIKIDLIITPETVALDKFFEVTIDNVVYSYYSFSNGNVQYNDQTRVIQIYYSGANETLAINSIVIAGIGHAVIYSAYLRIYYVTCD